VAGSSGGSLLSWSLTPAAATVRVHDSVSARLVAGSTVKVVGPPVIVTATLPLIEQRSVMASGARVTGSVNVTVGLTSRPWPWRRSRGWRTPPPGPPPAGEGAHGDLRDEPGKGGTGHASSNGPAGGARVSRHLDPAVRFGERSTASGPWPPKQPPYRQTATFPPDATTFRSTRVHFPCRPEASPAIPRPQPLRRGAGQHAPVASCCPALAGGWGVPSQGLPGQLSVPSPYPPLPGVDPAPPK
jgi:hypothetical protein